MADASVSALSKVVQVLPAQLRRRVEALRAATVDSPFSEAPQIQADVLATVAQATRDHERSGSPTARSVGPGPVRRSTGTPSPTGW